MSSRRLSDTPFLVLLPNSLAEDPTMRAAAAALDAMQPQTLADIPRLLLWARLYGADLPHALAPPLRRLSGGDTPPPLTDAELDLLAWQLHVEGYEGARSTEQRRRMVLESIPIHRKKGTPWAVETALRTLLEREVSLREWFEYGGEPHYFRVHFDVSEAGLDERRLTDAFALVAATKNVRSWLDGIHTATVRALSLTIGAGLVTRTVTRPRLHFPRPAPVPVPLNQRGAAVAVTRSIIHVRH